MADRIDAEQALADADAAIGRLDIDAAVAHLSAAIRAFAAGGDSRRAALSCCRLGDLYANAIGNRTAARAWFARARRLVADEPPCVEQGWVAVASMGCDVDDPVELLAAAELALDRARTFGDVNLETKALADAGLARVQAGDVDAGMALLDEAMALACGPADDLDTVGKSACSLFTACYYAADFGRAGSWGTLLRQRGLISRQAGSPIFTSGHCDSVQAALLVELGRWGEAEAVLTAAQAAFEAAMRMPSWHPDIHLADLRVRQGRLADAEALLLGRDEAMEALLPAARLHLARRDLDVARATVRRGLRLVGNDQLRGVELLAILVDVELAAGDGDAARAACEALTERVADVAVRALRARASGARARVLAAGGDVDGAIAAMETAVDLADVDQLPWRRAVLLIELAALRERAGDRAAALLDAKSAASILVGLDVVLDAGQRAILDRLAGTGTEARTGSATLARDGKWWDVSCAGLTVRLPATKGLAYLAELIARPGVEQHSLDLVDRVEGVGPAGVVADRRALGDAGALLDGRARDEYRRWIVALRVEIDDAVAGGLFETAEARRGELDQLVAQLAAAFGIGGRTRRASSAAERARLNVTRALRSAIAKITEALPDAGRSLDRHVRTGTYCAYEPAGDELRWIVQSAVNERAHR